MADKNANIKDMTEKQKVKEITDKLEEGLKELFNSEQYKSYLSTMSKFHNYSANNIQLIAMQRPDATLVAGYQAWQKNFERHVNRGEKAIRILAPAPYKIKEERDKIDRVTGELIFDENGMPQREEVEIKIPAFRVVSVFDVAQTNGKPLPELEAKELLATVERYEDFKRAVMNIAPVSIEFADISGDSKGYYNFEEKRIVVQENMAESQTLKTMIHETAHSILHDKEVSQSDGLETLVKDRNTKEVEAESIAFTVCQHFGIDTSDYSFGYIAGWSSGKDMKELKSSLDTIRRTASELIKGIEGQLQELHQNREMDGRANEQLKDSADKESQLLKGSSDKYGIYQLKDTPELDAFRFEGTASLMRRGITKDNFEAIKPDNYELIYTGELSGIPGRTQGEKLGEIFVKFNTNHPEDYKGHSLSVSDIVVLYENGGNSAHFVDSFGFTRLPDFMRGLEQAIGMENEQSMPAEKAEQEAIQEQKEDFNELDVKKQEPETEQNISSRNAPKPEQPETEKYPAVYRQSLSYANKHEESKAYTLSRRLDLECIEAIEKAINNNFDGMHLNSDVVKPVLEKYGEERMAFVLSSTIQQELWDGRFSRDNKDWALQSPLIEDIIHGIDVNRRLIVSSHQAVLNGFVDLFRKEVKEREKIAAQENVQKSEPESKDIEEGDEIIDLGDEREQVMKSLKKSLEGRSDISQQDVQKHAPEEMGETGHIVPESVQSSVVADFKAKTNELFHEISEMNPPEIEETVKCHVQAKMDEIGIDAIIVDVAVVGSRCRGLEEAGSDLDVVVELSTDEREDVLFDTFNEDKLRIGGIVVDINPITAQRTGTLENYLPQVEEYLEEIREAREQEAQKRVKAGTKEDVEVTFIVSECGEFHSYGEVHENIPTVEEAIGIWKQIPPERLNAIPAIGIHLHRPGDEPYQDVEMDILVGNLIDLEMLEFTPEIRTNPLAMDAIAEIMAKFPEMEIDGMLSEKLEAKVWEKRMPDLTPAEQLAVEIDRFTYAYDVNSYHDNVRRMSENVSEITKMLEQGDTEDMKVWLNEVISEGAMPEKETRVKELIAKLAEYKPLAKIEEMEEQNYNMVENVLNNGCEKLSKEEVKKMQDKPVSRQSLKARLADKKAQIAGQGKEREENAKNKQREI